MVALNFHKQFASLVKNGEKRQTIRASNRRYDGCKLQLYTGQRTKKCKKLKEVICKESLPIILDKYGVLIEDGWLVPSQREKLAHDDGFKDYKEMWKFFEPRADETGHFLGWLITW